MILRTMRATLGLLLVLCGCSVPPAQSVELEASEPTPTTTIASTLTTPEPTATPTAEAVLSTATKTPDAKATPKRTTIETELCGTLPSLSTLRGWPVEKICGPGSSYAGPPPPGGRRSVEPPVVADLGDGTFITKRNDRCFRARVEQCMNKCLPPETLIATPEGDVAVRSLAQGARVWTRDRRGKRVEAVILRVGHVPATLGHELVRVRFADGRTITASVGHPLDGGAGIETLEAGDAYDGTRVVSSGRRSPSSGGTYDLLPSGGTGIYWADGVPLGSTLSAEPAPELGALRSSLPPPQ